MSTSGEAFCINCGEEISANAGVCPECGANQDPEKLDTEEDHTTEEQYDGFTSWAPGFKPGSTFRNIGIGFAYLLFFYIGMFVLAYGYLRENPESGSTLAWILGILLILAGLGGLTEGTTAGIAGGIVAVVIGIVVLPIVRDRIGVGNPPPGIKQGNTARRNAIISVAYGFGALVVAGAALPETEPSDSPSDSESSSDQEQPPGTRWYDSDTEIGVMEGVEAEVDSIGNMYIRGTAENFSDTDYGYVQLEWEVYDETEAKIADGLANTNGLSSGQQWRFEALAPNAADVDSYNLVNITAS